MHRRHKRQSLFHVYVSPLVIVHNFHVIAVAIASATGTAAPVAAPLLGSVLQPAFFGTAAGGEIAIACINSCTN